MLYIINNDEGNYFIETNAQLSTINNLIKFLKNESKMESFYLIDSLQALQFAATIINPIDINP